jgi:hypothetical protein
MTHINEEYLKIFIEEAEAGESTKKDYIVKLSKLQKTPGPVAVKHQVPSAKC